MVLILPPVITLDGLSGSGKGTIGLALAKHLNWHFLDSGAIYRSLAYAVRDEPLIATQIAQRALNLSIRFQGQRVFLGEEEITHKIRSDSISSLASILAGFPLVRENLLNLQRSFRKLPGLVADGRDMGTVVFPEAKLKFFFKADLMTRAQRRKIQLQALGVDGTVQQLMEELSERDARDSQRWVAPLKADKVAVIIDTTELTIDEVLQQILVHVNHVFN